MSLKCHYAKVVIPGDPKYTDIAGNFVGSVARRLGFGEKAGQWGQVLYETPPD